MRPNIKQKLLLMKTVLLSVLLLPLVHLALAFMNDDLGANPVERMTHVTGDWALRILLLSLCMTPVQLLLKWRKAILMRRLIGLTAFGYAALHFGVYLVFDQELSLVGTMIDVKKRPYITAGFAALCLMVPLAITSTDRQIKKMGSKRWQMLHKSVYLVTTLAIVHYWWLVKADITKPLIYGFIFAALMFLRLGKHSLKMRMPLLKRPPQ
ncbi:MAG: sulfoxide reductase heme-binding subunit YedZ [Deltaproteobacteria bacterium]|nr:sulfoxide reductase heme-binding subunit YedZ [Deltaproteobacteria bacterium]